MTTVRSSLNISRIRDIPVACCGQLSIRRIGEGGCNRQGVNGLGLTTMVEFGSTWIVPFRLCAADTTLRRLLVVAKFAMLSTALTAEWVSWSSARARRPFKAARHIDKTLRHVRVRARVSVSLHKPPRYLLCETNTASCASSQYSDLN